MIVSVIFKTRFQSDGYTYIVKNSDILSYQVRLEQAHLRRGWEGVEVIYNVQFIIHNKNRAMVGI